MAKRSSSAISEQSDCRSFWAFFFEFQQNSKIATRIAKARPQRRTTNTPPMLSTPNLFGYLKNRTSVAKQKGGSKKEFWTQISTMREYKEPSLSTHPRHLLSTLYSFHLDYKFLPCFSTIYHRGAVLFPSLVDLELLMKFYLSTEIPLAKPHHNLTEKKMNKRAGVKKRRIGKENENRESLLGKSVWDMLPIYYYFYYYVQHLLLLIKEEKVRLSFLLCHSKVTFRIKANKVISKIDKTWLMNRFVFPFLTLFPYLYYPIILYYFYRWDNEKNKEKFDYRWFSSFKYLPPIWVRLQSLWTA